jgi:hypothetical protein
MQRQSIFSTIFNYDTTKDNMINQQSSDASLRRRITSKYRGFISWSRLMMMQKNVNIHGGVCNRPSESHQHLLASLDLFSFSPIYEHTSYSSYFGAICSLISITTLLLYIVVTMKDFIVQPPELVKQGSIALPVMRDQMVFEPPPVAIEISYWKKDEHSGNWTNPKVNFTNSDPYFRYSFTAKTIEEQDRLDRIETNLPGEECSWYDTTTKNLVCPDQELRLGQKIQGMYNLPVYQYFEVEVIKCTIGRHHGCASREEIDALLESGDVMVILHTKEEIFDTTKYHNKEIGGYHSKEKRGVDTHIQSWRFYALPDREQLTELYMEGRSIRVEERYIGSPPLTESSFDLMSFHSIATTYKKVSADYPVIMNFYFRLYAQTSEEELEYWIRSLLDLFSYWGAMTSFLSVCSFGILAKWYNRWKFQSNLRLETPKAIGTPKMTLNNQSDDNKMIDIRLFNQEDFNKTGRLVMTKEEFYFPSTPYGEVRKIALIEHLRKRKAAENIGIWYKNQTVRIKNRGLFAGSHSDDNSDRESDTIYLALAPV